jgi:hypothetical protein
MAAIVNARDVKLQATSPRLVTVTLPDNVVVPAVKSIRLTAPSLVFKLDTAGTATPSSITVTATLIQVSGTVSWSITGGTLTGSGSSRTLAQSDMTADTAIITASVTESGVTYSNTITIVRVRDGAAGSNGTNGQRGTVQLARAISGGSWSDTEAAAAITANGSGSPIAGDVVTLYNLTTSYSEARVYTAGAWSALSAYFPGSLLVEKSVVAGKVNGYGLQVLAGDYTGWALPVGSTKQGFFLGSQGLMLGNDTRYVRIDANGDLYAPGFSIIAGVAKFGGSTAAEYNSSISSAATTAVWASVSGVGKPADNATSGAPGGTYVGGTLAQTVESNAAAGKSASDAVNNAATGLATKLASNARSALSGAGGVVAGTLTWDTSGNRTGGYGVAMTSAGLVGYKPDGTATFSVGPDGSAVFGGTLSATAVNAVNTVNIADEAVVVPRAAYTAATVSVSYTPVAVQSVQITTHGQKVAIHFGAVITAYTTQGLGSYADVVNFSLYRGGTEIFSWISAGATSGGPTGFTVGASMPVFVDQPSAGTYTYEVRATTGGAQFSSVAKRSLVVMEVQR